MHNYLEKSKVSVFLRGKKINKKKIIHFFLNKIDNLSLYEINILNNVNVPTKVRIIRI